jgi:hypothetical protein
MTAAREEIYTAIEQERAYQTERWGTHVDDAVNKPNDWVGYISHYSTKWFDGSFSPYNSATVNAFRQSMIKVAALAVAAIESLDRQQKDGATAFYEKDVI